MFQQKQGSLLPSREFELALPDGVDLSGATCLFVWRPRHSTARNTITASLDASALTATVDLDAPAVATIGVYEFQFEITIAGKVLIVPEDDFYQYEVTATI